MGLIGRQGRLSIAGSTTDVHEVARQRFEDVLTTDVVEAYRCARQMNTQKILRHLILVEDVL